MRKSIHTPDSEALRALLLETRRTAGLTQVALAAKLGRHQSFVSKFETGERRLDVLELRAVCAALGVPLQVFVRQLEKRLS